MVRVRLAQLAKCPLHGNRITVGYAALDGVCVFPKDLLVLVIALARYIKCHIMANTVYPITER